MAASSADGKRCNGPERSQKQQLWHLDGDGVRWQPDDTLGEFVECAASHGLIMTQWIKCAPRNREALIELLKTAGPAYR